MSAARDWTGHRCNHLTIIGRGPRNTDEKDKHSLWVGVCDCGKKRLVRSNELTRKKAKHCGDFDCPYRAGVSRRRTHREVPILLTQAEARELRGLPCRCCGNPPGKRSVLRLYNPKEGYTPNNTFVLCEYCAGLLPEGRKFSAQLCWNDLIKHICKILNHLTDTGDVDYTFLKDTPKNT